MNRATLRRPVPFSPRISAMAFLAARGTPVPDERTEISPPPSFLCVFRYASQSLLYVLRERCPLRLRALECLKEVRRRIQMALGHIELEQRIKSWEAARLQPWP